MYHDVYLLFLFASKVAESSKIIRFLVYQPVHIRPKQPQLALMNTLLTASN